MTNIFKGATATAGLDGVNARADECIIVQDINSQKELSRGEAFEAWGAFWAGLSVEEVGALASGTASSELAFELIELENKILPLPADYFDQE